MKSARAFGDLLFDYYIVCVENDAAVTDNRIIIRATSKRWARKWAVTLGYYITHLAYELADRDGLDARRNLYFAQFPLV